MTSQYTPMPSVVSDLTPQMPYESGLVTGMFSNRENAERAYQAAITRGIKSDQMDLVMSKETRKQHFFNKNNSSYSELSEKATSPNTAETGGLIGGTIGALAAAIAAAGTSVVIPGLGLVIAGPLAAGLAGAGAGAAAGGFVGALMDWELPEDSLKKYENGIKDGHILLGARTTSGEEARLLQEEWEQYEAVDSPTKIKIGVL